MSVPDDFKLDTEVFNAFWVLGYQNVNDPEDANDTEKMIRQILHSMNIKSWNECYKIRVLGDHWVRENYKVASFSTDLQNASNEAVAVVKLVCDYFGQMGTEPYTVPERSDILAGRETLRPTDRAHRDNEGRSDDTMRRLAVQGIERPDCREQKRRSRKVRILGAYTGEIFDEYTEEESTDDDASCDINSRPSDYRRKRDGGGAKRKRRRRAR